MCEFCVQHGEGKKWYLEAKNYSQDLLSDERRRQRIQEMMSTPPDVATKNARELDVRMDRLDHLPGIARRIINWRVTQSLKQVHYGQVLPIEDHRGRVCVAGKPGERRDLEPEVDRRDGSGQSGQDPGFAVRFGPNRQLCLDLGLGFGQRDT